MTCDRWVQPFTRTVRLPESGPTYHELIERSSGPTAVALLLTAHRSGRTIVPASHAERHLRRRHRRFRRLRRHARGAPRPARRAGRDRRGRPAREHAHRLQHARDAVRLPQPPDPDDAAGQGRVRFRAQPRRRRQDDAVERGRAAAQPARLQGAHLRRRRRRLADRLQGHRAVLRRDRARGRRLRQPRRPRRSARRRCSCRRSR